MLFCFLYDFLDQMNYSLTQTDMANPETQYCDFTHLNPIQNSDPAKLTQARYCHNF